MDKREIQAFSRKTGKKGGGKNRRPLRAYAAGSETGSEVSPSSGVLGVSWEAGSWLSAVVSSSGWVSPPLSSGSVYLSGLYVAQSRISSALNPWSNRNLV